MKINYKNTALSFLDDPNNFPFHTPEAYNVPMTEEEDQKLGRGLRMAFSEADLVSDLKKNIQYVTQPFYEAYCKSAKKLKDIVKTTVIEDIGTLIIPWPTHTQTIFYMLQMDGSGDNWDFNAMMTMFTKSPKSDSFGLDLCIYIGKKEKEIRNLVWKGFEEQGRDMAWWIADLMLFKTFLKYAEVETKIVKPNRRDHHIGVKYVNETKSSVEILDSTYFTTLIKSEGFKVRGHFRLQPYGPNLSNKKIIWISDFEKDGYTRTAKILNK